ncbi:hypothetical protein C6A77_10760 [Pseudomonas sp. AFG_SD02_1510_Pfu_092]|nr:hypothetical protein C6A77_10760 [Pseudomonas sp. AFG_SD02_1510_Pfu_092]
MVDGTGCAGVRGHGRSHRDRASFWKLIKTVAPTPTALASRAALCLWKLAPTGIAPGLRPMRSGWELACQRWAAQRPRRSQCAPADLLRSLSAHSV